MRGWTVNRKATTPAESESVILADIRLALGQDPRVVLWRNTSGKFLADFGAKGTRPVSTGLTVGASDLIGMVKCDVVKLPPMDQDGYASMAYRQTIARFLALEVKTTTGRERPEQKLFRDLVNNMGGFAAVVRSVDDARDAVERAARGDRG